VRKKMLSSMKKSKPPKKEHEKIKTPKKRA